MATLEQLSSALVSADAAGDVAAARALAAEISKLSSQASTSPANTAADVAKSAGIGVVKGGVGLAGMGGDLRNVASAAVDWIGGKAGASPETVAGIKDTASKAVQFSPLASLVNAPSSQDIQKKIEGVTGEFYKPQTTAGEYAKTIGEFAPAALAGPGGVGRRIAMQAVVPAVSSETAGQATKGTAAEPYARVAGALAGPFAASGVSRAITPFPASPERQRLVQALQGEGVNLTAGKSTGSRPLRWAESVLEDTPLVAGRARRVAEREAEQFTAAALRRVGENAPRATPAVIDQAFNRMGQTFDDLAARNVARADQQLATDVRSALDDYYNLVAPPNRTPAVTNYVQEMVTAAQRNNGAIPGDVYQSLRSRIERAARGMGNNPEARTALREIRESLDDAMERSIAAAGNQADLGAWREVRNQYRNMLVIEKAVTGAGENAAQGLISPSALRNAAVNQNRRAYARGQGDFAELARSGEALMKPLPQSGTPPRLGAMGGFGAGVGATLGSTFGLVGTALGGAAGYATPGLIGQALLSRPMQAYMGNQAVNRLQPGRSVASPLAIANALRPALGY